ncbi:MAG: arylesterase [Hyphomicrobiales bacterium]|nr:arylesterase [Hyphomicrobiales bacterium]
MNYNSATSENSVRFEKWLLFAVCILILMATKPSSAEEKNIVVLGDSLVAGYGLAPGEAFPEQLSRLLKDKGIEANIINAGVSGDTTAGGLARLDWSIQQGTDAVIIELGANDVLRGIAPTQTQNNLESIIQNLKKRNIKVLLAGMKSPPNMGQKYADEFNAIYPALAAKHDIHFYPFFLDGVVANSDLNQSDGIHPTAKGITLITRRFLPSAEKLIEELCKQ